MSKEFICKSPDIICKVINTIFRKSELLYIIYDNKKYYERDSGDHSKNKDKNYPCSGYWTDECKYWSKTDYCAIYPDTIIPTDPLNTITYFTKFDKDYKHYDDTEVLDDLTENTKITFIKDIQIYNPRGVNPDHRGSNHCQLKLPFVYSIIVPKGSYTIFDLASKLFNLKSHKFENHYELYCECFYERNHPLYNMNMVYNDCYVLQFDHGS